MSISKNEILMGRDKTYATAYTKEISDNVDKLLIPMNIIRAAYGKPMRVTSGWRPAAVNNKTAGAAKKSNHMLGLAVDIADPDGKLWAWVLANLELMQQNGLYLEDARWTKGWVHFQCALPGSKKRIFIPYADQTKFPMTQKDIWTGKYDAKYDKAN